MNFLLSYLFFSFIHVFLFASLSSDLSVEEKVGQILMPHFHGKEANAEARRLIQEAYVGGIIYYDWANGLESPEQVSLLSRDLQALAQQTPHALPLLIAIDQEGGRVSRLKNGFTLLPSPYVLSQTESSEWGREAAYRVGKELKTVGIVLNLSPVVDLWTNPENRVIGERSFGGDPVCVTCWGLSVLQGYKRAGVIGVLKHFPGHGEADADSHEKLPVVWKNRQELEQKELFPFCSLASQAEVMMTGHLFVPALDPEICTTFSRQIIEGVLREEIGFQGVVMTDSLVMKGILSQVSGIEEAVLKSLEAGHDLILLGGKQLLDAQEKELSVEDVLRLHRFLVNAVKEGRLSEERLDQAVNRLLMLKYGLFK